ncbi:GL23920 [Drosophila persimilis]|uniref:GL23920 n=1 Tax=Drosophila persimilis TaxID=7234 RepID=B4G2K1_DROPE|nr:GL23920 [Drosophila persimilis]
MPPIVAFVLKHYKKQQEEKPEKADQEQREQQEQHQEQQPRHTEQKQKQEQKLTPKQIQNQTKRMNKWRWYGTVRCGTLPAPSSLLKEPTIEAVVCLFAYFRAECIVNGE